MAVDILVTIDVCSSVNPHIDSSFSSANTQLTFFPAVTNTAPLILAGYSSAKGDIDWEAGDSIGINIVFHGSGGQKYETNVYVYFNPL